MTRYNESSQLRFVFSTSSSGNSYSTTTADASFFSFDPLQSRVSSSLLQQEEEELSSDERVLKRALQEYLNVVMKGTQEDDEEGEKVLTTPELTTITTEHNNSLHQSALEDLQRAYMALEYWEEALRMEHDKCQQFTTPNTDDYADSIHAQGKLQLRLEQFDTARQLYQEALTYFEATNNKVQQGHVYISMAGWHFFRQQLPTALECLQQAEALLESSSPALLVKCLDNQGLIYRLWGEFDTALDKYQQALQSVDTGNNGSGTDMERALRMHVADMFLALEDSEQALLKYQELLGDITSNGAGEERDLSMQGVLWHNIATIHVDQGEYDRALEEFQLALQTKEAAGGENNPEMARTWNSLGGLLAGVFDEKRQALECFRKALLIARIHAVDGDPQRDPDVLRAIQNITIMENELQKEDKG